MIYLDSGATSFRKPPAVAAAMAWAVQNCANPGRGGYDAAMLAAKTVYTCRERAGALFDCKPEQVVLTQNCTHGLNMAIGTLVKPEGKVVISGFEHNAVTRPLYALRAKVTVAGRRLFDRENTLAEFEKALRTGADAAVFTHVSNVFGYILPVEEMAAICNKYGVPFIVDAAQSAGSLPVSLAQLGADFIAMPGHKGLLGPQGTGLLLCARLPDTFMAGGTGSESMVQAMPDYLPDRGEAGTLNVPGIAGLGAALKHLQMTDMKKLAAREHAAAMRCARYLQDMGLEVFAGEDQAATVSFVPKCDCEELADQLAKRGVAVRAGLHCAPLAHESAGTLETGTVRVSFGADATLAQADIFAGKMRECMAF